MPGWMHLTGDGYEVYHGSKNEPGPKMKKKDIESEELEKACIEAHFVNFLDGMRSCNWQDLNQDIREGHMSNSMMLLGNIAYLTGRKLTFNGQDQKFVNDKYANKYLIREWCDPYVLPKEI